MGLIPKALLKKKKKSATCVGRRGREGRFHRRGWKEEGNRMGKERGSERKWEARKTLKAKFFS